MIFISKMALIKLFLQRCILTSNINTCRIVVKTCRQNKSWKGGGGEGRRKKDYLRIKGQYSRRSNPSEIIIFLSKVILSDSLQTTWYQGREGEEDKKNKGCVTAVATKKCGKAALTLWTTMVEILEDPNGVFTRSLLSL